MLIERGYDENSYFKYQYLQIQIFDDKQRKKSSVRTQLTDMDGREFDIMSHYQTSEKIKKLFEDAKKRCMNILNETDGSEV